MNWDLPDVPAGLRKGWGPEIKLPTFVGSYRIQGNYRKKHLLLFHWLHYSLWLCGKFLEHLITLGFPESSVGKESADNAGEPGSIPGSGRSAGKGIGSPLQNSRASLVAQLVKNPPAMPGFDPWVGKTPWRERLPTLVFWPGEFHGLYNPLGG